MRCSNAGFRDRGKGPLTDLVRRAEAGDEVILTRHGQSASCRRLFIGGDFSKTDLESVL